MNRKANFKLFLGVILAGSLISGVAEARTALKFEADYKPNSYEGSTFSAASVTHDHAEALAWPESFLAIHDTQDLGKSGDNRLFEDFQPWENFGSSGYLSNPCNILNVVAVPEPETYAMLLAGLAMFGLIAWRRKSPGN